MKNTKSKHYVLVDKESREVIACISDNGKDDILAEGCRIESIRRHRTSIYRDKSRNIAER